MEGSVGEFQDWELLHDLETTGLDDSSMFSLQNSTNFEIIRNDLDSESMIRSNYFSVGNRGSYTKNVPGGLSEEPLVHSVNPTLIDSGSDNRNCEKNFIELGSDLDSEPLNEHKISNFDAKMKSVVAKVEIKAEVEEMKAETESLERVGSDDDKLSVFDPRNELRFAENVENKMGYEEFGQIRHGDEDLPKLWSDMDGAEPGSVKVEDGEREMALGDLETGDRSTEDNSNVEFEEGRRQSGEKESVAIEEIKPEAKSDSAEEKRGTLWWKVPFDVLKFCISRVSPAWSFSVVAALMGFIILTRRLYKMKKKSQSLQLKVTVDDKKISQFVNRASRLNEAFSVVRRVPTVRPTLPATGLHPWPVMSLMR